MQFTLSNPSIESLKDLMLTHGRGHVVNVTYGQFTRTYAIPKTKAAFKAWWASVSPTWYESINDKPIPIFTTRLIRHGVNPDLTLTLSSVSESPPKEEEGILNPFTGRIVQANKKNMRRIQRSVANSLKDIHKELSENTGKRSSLETKLTRVLHNSLSTVYRLPYDNDDIVVDVLIEDLRQIIREVSARERLNQNRKVHITLEGDTNGTRIMSFPHFAIKDFESRVRSMQTTLNNMTYIVAVKTIDIRVFAERSGGCGDNVKMLKCSPTSKQRFCSPRSTNNNCFFACIAQELGFKTVSKSKSNAIRTKFGIDPNSPVDVSTALAIIKDQGLEDSISIDGFHKAKAPTKTLHLIGHGHCSVGHWVFIETEKVHKQQTCSRCGLTYWKVHSEKACLQRMDRKQDVLARRDIKNRIIRAKKSTRLPNDQERILHYDIETFNNGKKGSINQLMCLGYEFWSPDANEWVYRFIPGKDCLDVFIDQLATLPEQVKYLNAYNGSNFDHYELLKAYLRRENDLKVRFTLNNGSLIGGGVYSGKKGNVDRFFNFFDMAKHGAPGPLSKKLEAFKIDTLKGEIDYKKFAEWETLTPEFQQQVMAYQKSDVVGMRKLYNVMNEQLNVDFGMNMSKFISASQRCFELWKSDRFLGKDEVIGLPSYEESCFYRKATYGGRTYKNKTHFKSSQYQGIMDGSIKHSDVTDFCEDKDVVSLYPTAMERYPYPIGESIQTDIEVPDKLGIYRCKVTCPKNLLTPQLPRHDDGLKWDLIDREQHLCTEDMRRAREYGYKIEVIDGFYWEKSSFVFKSYINEMYKKKGESIKDSPQYLDAKICMNGLYGKLIQRPIVEETELVKSFEQLWTILDTRKVMSVSDVPEKEWLIISHAPREEEEYNKACTKPTQMGVFVLAYSRTIMSEYIKAMNPIDSEKDLFYYTDTDSIQTHTRCASRVPDSKGLGGIDNDLKNDGRIIEGVWIAPKLYRLTYIDNKNEIHVHVRGKGVNGKCFEKHVEWYDRMLDGETIKGDEVWRAAEELDVPCFKRVHVKRSSKEKQIPLFSIVKDTRERTLNKEAWSGRKFISQNCSVPWGYNP